MRGQASALVLFPVWQNTAFVVCLCLASTGLLLLTGCSSKALNHQPGSGAIGSLLPGDCGQLKQSCEPDSKRDLCKAEIYAALQQGCFEEAFPPAVRLVRLRPSDADTQRWLGYLYLQKSDFNKAYYHTYLSLQQQPGNYAARVNLARIQAARGYTRDAERRYASLRKEYPQRIDLLLILGRHFYRQGRFKAALDPLQKAYSIGPGNREQPIANSPDFSRHAKQSQDAEVTCSYGEVLAGLHRVAEALPVLEQCLRLVPDRVPAQEYRLQALLATGQYKKGLEYLETLSEDRRTRRMLVPGALLAFHAGEYTKSRELWQAATQAGLKFRDQALYLGLIAARQNRPTEAREHLTHFIEQNAGGVDQSDTHPELGMAYYQLARVQTQLQDESGAYQSLQQACALQYQDACQVLNKLK